MLGGLDAVIPVGGDPMPPHADGAAPVVAPALGEAMAAWRRAHLDATFAEIEIEATRQVAGVRAGLIATALEVAAPTGAPVCAPCGRVMVRDGGRTRTIITSQQEPVAVRGQRYRCPACGAGLFPPR